MLERLLSAVAHRPNSVQCGWIQIYELFGTFFVYNQILMAEDEEHHFKPRDVFIVVKWWLMV